MSEQSVQEELLHHLVKLPPEQQRQVLEFARALRQSIPIGKPGTTLLQFAGTIEEDDLSMMARAIEEGCEQVNRDEW